MQKNKNKHKSIIITFLILAITVFILSIPIYAYFLREKKETNGTKMIVTTTTMLQDLVKHLIGDVEQGENQKYKKIKGIECQTLMGVGIDPHNYKTKLSDRLKIKNADLVVVNGLHLEAKMPDAFKLFTKKDCLYDAGKSLLENSKFKNKLLKEEGLEDYDPHIWFNPDLWIEIFQNLKKVLLEKEIVKTIEDKNILEQNFKFYSDDLGELKKYIIKEMEELKQKIENKGYKFIIVTAHDAFSYWKAFCKENKCEFELEPIQGISTQTEASNNKIVTLAQKLAKNNVKAIFTESSMPKNSLRSLKEEVDNQRKKQGLKGEIEIPKDVELYSDSLGKTENEEKFIDKNYKHSTYIGAFLNNIEIIKNYLGEKNYDE